MGQAPLLAILSTVLFVATLITLIAVIIHNNNDDDDDCVCAPCPVGLPKTIKCPDGTTRQCYDGTYGCLDNSEQLCGPYCKSKGSVSLSECVKKGRVDCGVSRQCEWSDKR